MYKDFYGEPVMHHHDHCHDHMGPLEFAQVSNAGAYARLYSKLITHIEDNVRHITAEERDKWNKKADKIELEELALKMVKKANKSDIPTLVSELKNDVPYLTKADLNTQIVNLDVPTWEDLNNWITGKLSGYALESWVLQKIGNIDNIDLSSYATRDWVSNNYMPKFDLDKYATMRWVSEQLNGYTPGSGSSTTYTAGEGINIANNVISLKVAKDGQLGGIRTNYQTDSNNRNYGIRINNSGQAYVNVPWEKGSGSGSGSGNSGRYYDQAFKTTETLNMPALPGAGFPNADDGWRRFAENADATKYVWMATRAINDGVADEWLGPWLISGPEGQAGRDGKGIEFVYIRTTSDTVDAAAISNLNAQHGTDTFQADDYIPTNWTDNPQGITAELPYEWVAIRTSDRNGVWSQFIGPILWSKWGQNGMDGDGVEYIFYAAASEVTFGSGSLNPANWTIVQTDEYLGPDNGETWKDNPIDLATIGQGAYEWVSMRKRNGEGGEWGAFSQPALWAYYSKDGVADGYILNLTKDSFLCQVDEEGTSQAATFETAVELFYNGTRVTPTAISIGQINLNGQAVTSTQARATNNNGNIIITVGNIQDATFKTLFIPVTVSFEENGESEEKTVIASVYFFRAADGKGISLNTSASVIKFNYYKTVANPTELEIWALIGDTKITPTSSDKLGYNFYWKYNSTTSTTAPQLLTSNTISNYDTNYTGITVMLYKGNEVYLTQAIPYVFDGAPGIGVKQYSIQVLSSTLAVLDDTDNSKKVNGTVTFKAFRHFGGEDDIEITPSSRPNNENVVVYANNRELHPSYGNGVWTATINNEGYSDGYGYASLRIISDTSSVLASVVVPFAIQGPQGSSTVQGLNGTVMRLWNYDRDQMYFDGEVAENGITYLDIVRYPADSATGGAYYRLKPADRAAKGEGAANPDYPTNNEYWEEFSTPADSAAFQAIIANYGFIENLTGREIVVTNSDNTPVAGITNGTAVDGDGDAISGVNRGNVRIWAGTPEANGNLADCPFYVTDEGFLHAENGEFGGTVSGVTGTFKSLQCVDANGNNVGELRFDSDGKLSIYNGDVIHNGTKAETKANGDTINRSLRFYANNMWVRNSFGARGTNTAIIDERNNYVTYVLDPSGLPSQRLVTDHVMSTTSYGDYTSYDVPLYVTAILAPSGSTPSDPDRSNSSSAIAFPVDTVIIIGRHGAGKRSYKFTGALIGKKIRVINTSSVEIYLATHTNGCCKLKGKESVDLTYVRDVYPAASDAEGYTTNSEGAGWFICGNTLTVG